MLDTATATATVTYKQMAAKATTRTTTTTTQTKSLIEPSRAAVKSSLIDTEIVFLFGGTGFQNLWIRKFIRRVLQWCPSVIEIFHYSYAVSVATNWDIYRMNMNSQIFYIIFLFYFQILTNKDPASCFYFRKFCNIDDINFQNWWMRLYKS